MKKLGKKLGTWKSGPNMEKAKYREAKYGGSTVHAFVVILYEKYLEVYFKVIFIHNIYFKN